MNETFRIFQLSPEDVEHIQASENEPHTHDYEELLLGVEGQLEHFIDFESSKMDAPFVSFVAKGKVHRVIPYLKNGKCNIWAIRFKSEFIPETTFQLYAYYHNNANIQLPADRCFQRMETICSLMLEETKASTPDYSIIRHLLSALFTMIESERKKQESDQSHLIKTQSSTFKTFLLTLEENFRRPEGVEFYAEKLFMSSRNLNIICQNIMQQSVSELIETRKLIEAKNLLTTTDKTIAEIGFELGYNEKSYFTSVFKRKAGITPSEFRKEMQQLIS
ncbi:helix-turn-helix domain-containing protein [Mangrovibacterium diazotrophicum]|uniref:AraC-like DNA-binding protein n=1 Tax=Mangrovibacterium diazotrophicum TaxID=1261403 RepID=A0A419W846_9BACT|nr:AraC family transcriptional regulator [Mangrovibacterium diazotrophicum]RKD91628.1 AraC-like DNA-binding protein [Mangrovibacterium diazotrophicum]